LRFVGALEGLRGYAALLMVVYHAWVLTGGPLLGGGRAVLSGGFLAVDLFFVLSAFVLTLPAARTGSFGSWRDYALRRAARILPAYYVPLPVAYGMEETDLALRLHSRGGRILSSSWLRVFHDTDLQRHAEPHVTAGSIANLALLAYLRYPVSLWSIGAWQCANRVLWLLRHGRHRGIWRGLTMIPAHLRAHRRFRLTVSNRAVRSYLALRRAPSHTSL